MQVEFKLGRLVCFRHVFIYLGNDEDGKVYCFGCHNCGFRLYTESEMELYAIKDAIDNIDNPYVLKTFTEVEAA